MNPHRTGSHTQALHRFLLVLGFFVFGISVHGQTLRVVVPSETDSSEWLPLADAYVQFKSLSPENSKSEGFLTDSTGQSTCTLSFPIVFQISYLGYKAVLDTLYKATNKEIRLQRNETQLESVVVTAQYAPVAAEQSIYRIRVLDRARIESQAAVNLSDLLQQELNIRVSNDNVLGSSLSLQGLGGQNIKILIDGVPVIGRMNGNIDLNQINLNNIERIEMIEGPLSVQYGTDAAGGVINLISKDPKAKSIQAETNLYTESVSRANADFRVATRLGKNQIALTGGRYFFGGWANENDDRRITWKPRTQHFLTADYARSLGKWQLGYQLSGFQEELLNRGDVLARRFRPYAFDETHVTRRLNNVLTASTIIEKNRFIDLTFSHQYFDRIKTTYRKDLVSLEEEVTPNAEQQDTARFDHYMARGTYSMNRENTKTSYQIGYDLNHQRGFGKRIENGSQDQGDYALFLTAEYRPSIRWTLRPGLRYAYNTQFRAPLIPSLHVKYDFTTLWSARASVAQGFRAPDLKELYLNFVDVNHNLIGNPDLRAERANNVQGQLNYKQIKGRVLWKWEFMGYFNQLRNQIQLTLVDISTLRYTYTNIGETRTGGIQSNVGMRTERLNIQAGIVYMGQWNAPEVRPAGEAAWFYSPQANLQAGYRIPKLEVEIQAFCKYNGRVQFYSQTSETETSLSYVNAFSMFDLTLNRHWWKKRLRTTVGVRNLLDVTNIAAAQAGGAHSTGATNVPVGMGRLGFLGVNLSF